MDNWRGAESRLPISNEQSAISNQQSAISNHLTLTCTSMLLQQHRSPPPPSPVSSFACARSTYEPGALNVAVVVASITASTSSPCFNRIGWVPNFTLDASPLWTYQLSITSAWGPPRGNSL